MATKVWKTTTKVNGKLETSIEKTPAGAGRQVLKAVKEATSRTSHSYDRKAVDTVRQTAETYDGKEKFGYDFGRRSLPKVDKIENQDEFVFVEPATV